MRVKHSRPTISQQRMAAAIPPVPKKSRSILTKIKKTILSPFSPKRANENLSHIDAQSELFSDREFSEEEEDVYDHQEFVQPNPSFEELHAAFLVKGKSPLNQQGSIRNLIGESTNWRPDDWSTVQGRSIPRTPVNQPKIYPNLSTVQENNEPLKREIEYNKPGQSQPVKKNCYGQEKGQPPTRVSERNKNKINQLQTTTLPADPIELANQVEPTALLQPTEQNTASDPTPIDDTYLNLIPPSEPDTEEEIDEDFSSVISHNESLHHSQLVKIAEDVERQMKSEFNQQQITSTPFSKALNELHKREQTFTTQSATQTIQPQLVSYRTQTEPPSTRLKGTQTVLSPPKPTQTQAASTTPQGQQQRPIKPVKIKSPAMDVQQSTHYQELYKCLRKEGASKEVALAGAKAAWALSQKTHCPSITIKSNDNKVAAVTESDDTVSTQSYYNSQKLLQNQQQQAIALLAQVPAFNGTGATRFEDWIQHFERVIDTAEFEEGRKLKLLVSKLYGSAGDCITTFQLNYPKESKSFSKVKQCLHERFHGGEDRKAYLTEFKNCMRKSGESIRDYACRLQKLYSFAYPTEPGKAVDPDVVKLRETMLMDGFLGGLKPTLRERMSYKDYRTFNDMVKTAEKYAGILNESKLESKRVEFVNKIAADTNALELRETKEEISALKSVIEQLARNVQATKLTDNYHESINAVTTMQSPQMLESRREIEELKNLLKANTKSYSDVMKQQRDAEKTIKNMQIQMAGMSQPVFATQPPHQYMQNHSNQFVNQSALTAPVYQNTPPAYGGQPNQGGRPPQREGRYCTNCATLGRNPSTHNTDKCGWGPNGPTCFKCHQLGHLARECPSAPPRVDGRYAPPTNTRPVPSAPPAGQLNPWNRGN